MTEDFLGHSIVTIKPIVQSSKWTDFKMECRVMAYWPALMSQEDVFSATFTYWQSESSEAPYDKGICEYDLYVHLM